MEELLALLAQLDAEQRRQLLVFLKALLNEQQSCRSCLLALGFAAKILQ